MILGISWSTTALACIAVSVRTYIRLRRKTSGWDDYLIHTALVIEFLAAPQPYWLAKGSADHTNLGNITLRVHPK